MAKYKPYRFVLYLIARGIALSFSVLPRPLLLGLARGMGRLAFLLAGRHRKKTVEHLKSAFGGEKSEKEIKTIAREVFENLALTAAEILKFPSLRPEKIRAMVDIGDAYEIYRGLIAEGKGLIGITSHIGNWELLAALFMLQGFKGKAVARRVRYEPYNRWIENLRRSVGIEIIYRGDSPREIIKLLQRGEILGMLPDQDIDSLRGVFVPFFGRPAFTTTAPVKLSLATGAPIITNFLVRLPHGKYRVVIGDIIRPRADMPREDALREYTAAWMKSCEDVIRRYPGQWGWMHNRWKTQPGTEKDGKQAPARRTP